MKQRPILFQAAMVQAILAGTKTQTRRVMKLQPAEVDNYDDIALLYTSTDEDRQEYTIGQKPFNCPYGEVGDVLWVRETHYAYGRWEQRFSEEKQRNEWHFVDLTLELMLSYCYDEEPPKEVQKKRKEGVEGYWKRPSIFMPYAAARLFLRIASIRVERLQDISEGDAWAEGCKKGEPTDNGGFFPAEESDPSGVGERGWDCAKDWYADLWEEINGAQSWAENPWVWVVEFTPTEKPA